MSWYLNPALTGFRNAVNKAYPNRDKKSDGTLGDEHHKPPSDHLPDPPPEEEVDAWDMDPELNGVGQPFENDIEILIGVFEAHESSKYWIYKQTIARRSTGWKREVYTGKYHTHVHWNTREEYDESIAPWIIPGDNMTTDSAVRFIDGRTEAMAMGRETVANNPAFNGVGSPVWIVTQIMEMQKKLDGIVSKLEALEIGEPGTGATADEVADELAQRLQQ